MQIEALTTALAAVHRAILAGQIDDLAMHTETISQAEPHLHLASPAQMHAIRHMAKQNAVCLQAAMKGIRAAQRRIVELQAARAGHATYDQRGQRENLGTDSGVLRQRI